MVGHISWLACDALLGLGFQRTGVGAGTEEGQREEPSGQAGRATQRHQGPWVTAEARGRGQQRGEGEA